MATDASQFGVGVVLYQQVDEKNIHIEFASKSLVVGQKNYLAAKRELLVIMFALKRWRPILVGRRFQVEMDHQALVYLHSLMKYIVLD